ncbi:IQ and AAA domain-containing protein 1 [Habropoda laboriosa]|uniref:IQ and AAA domain-containing protein 1 n=1 Tax=Habropoda laboriosa TaxID=597456 RepID=A0A0L7QNJ9_9HYME|nr:IQ and AAA domain-containing protein 1 [Habropoda laboriosa]
MSSTTYDELWKNAENALEELLQLDTSLQNAKPQKDRRKAHNMVSELYVRYTTICNKFELCYDQVIQPQKRILIKQLLDSCLGRILELKHELVEIDLSEYSYFDDILIKLNVTPQEVEIQVPRYFRRERLKEIEEKRKYIEDTLKSIGALDEVIIPKKMTESEAIRLIQNQTFGIRSYVYESIFLSIVYKCGTESTISKSTAVSSKESKKSKRSKSKKDSDGEQSEEETEQGFKSIPSNFLSVLICANQEYKEVWKNKDESSNAAQLPYLDMIENEKTKEVENEVRITVDQALRDDIEALQNALDRDRGFKGKRAKKVQKRIRRSGKKNKKRKEKDLTPDRTTESLFEELLTQGIIKLYRETPLHDFKGEKSFANHNLREKGKDHLPTLGDIRQLIAEYCILPLGNSTLRELTPLVRSVLIAGPHGSGKKMLVNAICTELGATLFDITPANIAGKYPGKSGVIMLIHLISKVSRLLQPSVIFMDGAEKPFVKKVSKTDKTDPKRLKKDLPKLVKSITNEDRVILIGISSSPWDGDQKCLYQTYDKVIYIPRPDYGSVSLIWKDLLYKYSGINRQFDTSDMTKICDGFTVGTILASINEVMTTKRIVQLRTHSLTQGELINALSTKDPVYCEEEDAFLAWLAKTPIYRQKQRAIELELQKLEEVNEKQKRKGKKPS